MSGIYIVWASDADKAQAKFAQMTDGERVNVLKRGDFSLIQAEDVDSEEYLSSGGGRYCIVFELID